MLWGSKKGDWLLGRKPNPESHPSQASGGDAWVWRLSLGRLSATMALLTVTLQSSPRGAVSWAAYEGLYPDSPCLSHGPLLHLLPLPIPGLVLAFSPLPG